MKDGFDSAWCRELFEAQGVFLSDIAVEQFRIYRAEILRWNSKANLVSKKDESRIIERHFLESALLSVFEEFQNRKLILDLGSGAGFPGVPLKIVCPNLKMTVLDSKRWKCLFLKSLLQKLDLEGVQVLCMRAEAAGQNETYRHKFDIIVSRAVTELSELYKLAEPLLLHTGLLVAMKGSSAEIEIEKMKKLYPDLNIEVKALHGIKSQKQQVVFVR